MALNEKITDEQLWDFADGVATAAEAAFLQKTLAENPSIAERLETIRRERAAFLAFEIEGPTTAFSAKLMARLAAEKVISTAPSKSPDWVMRGIFGGFGLVLMVLLAILMANAPDLGIRPPELNLPKIGFGWLRIFESKLFLWTVYLAFLIPALRVLDKKLAQNRLAF